MIADSIPWKEELHRSAERLEKKATQKRWTERSAFLVERDVMIGAYSIRKLLEAPAKLSDPIKRLHVPIFRFPLKTTRPPDWWDAYHWWEHYDLEAPSRGQVHVRRFCHLLVHSFVFAFHPTPKNDGLAGIFVNSELESREALTFIGTQTLVELFRAVGSDDVHSMSMHRDKDGRMRISEAAGQRIFLSPVGEVKF